MRIAHRINKICPVCKQHFITKYERVKCCSISCGNKNKLKKGKFISCKNCGKEVYLYPHDSNREFCSISCSSVFNNCGSKNGMYVDGRSKFAPIQEAIHHLKEYKQWRNEIFTRDDYTCQKCLKAGGVLHAHHVKRFSILFEQFLKEYNQFNPLEEKHTLVRLAINYKPFWEAEGITYCEECHKLEHKGDINYGREIFVRGSSSAEVWQLSPRPESVGVYSL